MSYMSCLHQDYLALRSNINTQHGWIYLQSFSIACEVSSGRTAITEGAPGSGSHKKSFVLEFLRSHAVWNNGSHQ